MDELEIKKAVGARIKLLRRQKGLTQDELAESIGKQGPAIQRIEGGKLNPSIYTLREIAGGLGITLDKLLSNL